MNFLCVEGSPKMNDKPIDEVKPVDVPTKAKKEISNYTVTLTESFHCETKGKIVLPTFACQIKGNKIRGFRDEGSQANLVTDALADRFNMEVIENNVKS